MMDNFESEFSSVELLFTNCVEINAKLPFKHLIQAKIKAFWMSPVGIKILGMIRDLPGNALVLCCFFSKLYKTEST